MAASLDVHQGLHVEHGPVTLRVVPGPDLISLGNLVARGLFPGTTSTLGSWYDPDDLAASARRTVAFHLTAMASVAPHDWNLPLGVYVDAQLVGVQGMQANDFLICRTVETGSWLIPSARGRGIGRAARAAILGLAFGLLEAEWALTSAQVGNHASARVTESLGYEPNGVSTIAHLGKPTPVRHWCLSRDRWRGGPARIVRWHGFDSWLDQVGLEHPNRRQ